MSGAYRRPVTVAVVGGGPAALMAAEVLAAAGAIVTVYDRMPSVGRKFLLAGRSGLNLTHSEPFERVLPRYGAAAAQLRPALEAFPPDAVRTWAEGLGQETFVGSSGRVFPRAWKASPLLRAWLGRLTERGVTFRPRHLWTGFDGPNGLTFATPDGEVRVRADATILALGGASWPRLGADGGWTDILSAAGIAVRPLRPSNCGLDIGWTEHFRERFEGEPLKRIALSFAGRAVRGDAVVTARGLEGGAVYPLSAAMGAAIEAGAEAQLGLDLRPDLAEADLAAALGKPRKGRSTSTLLRKAAGLAPVAIGLLREAAGPAFPAEPAALAALIKRTELRVTGTDAIERAISTRGGVALEEVDARLMLRSRPGTYVAGEMLDWDAPTGGYLLQACFATGAAAAKAIVPSRTSVPVI